MCRDQLRHARAGDLRLIEKPRLSSKTLTLAKRRGAPGGARSISSVFATVGSRSGRAAACEAGRRCEAPVVHQRPEAPGVRRRTSLWLRRWRRRRALGGQHGWAERRPVVLWRAADQRDAVLRPAPWNLSRQRASDPAAPGGQLAVGDAIIGIELTAKSRRRAPGNVETSCRYRCPRNDVAAHDRPRLRMRALSGQDVAELRLYGAERPGRHRPDVRGGAVALSPWANQMMGTWVGTRR